MKNFGFQGYDNVIYLGTNGKMTEISAAMGLTGLENLEEVVAVNRQNYYTYQRVLGDVRGLSLVSYDERERHNFQYIVFEVDAEAAGLSRDQLVAMLNAENVLARRYFFPGCHRMVPYRSCFPHAGLLLPETERLTARVLSLPNGTSVNAADIETFGGLIRFAIDHSAEIRRELLARQPPKP